MPDAPQPLHPTIRMHKGLERRGRPRNPEGTIVSRMEDATRKAADNIVKTHQSVFDAFGDRPYSQRQISEQKQVRRYMALKDDVNSWTGLIETKGLAACIKYVLRMEKLREKYPEDAKYGEEAAKGAQLKQGIVGNGQQQQQQS